MPNPPNILVTGAAGRLGSRVSNLLHRAGYGITATDILEVENAPYPFKPADLRDHQTALELLDGVEVLIHIGNHPGMEDKVPQVLFNENVSINQNMFQGAAETGVKRIIFASTLQLIGSHIDTRTVLNKPKPKAYPMDGDTPPDPSNVYALSKTVSETMLRYYAERCGIDVVALRFPLIHNNEDFVPVPSEAEQFTHIIEAFSGITYDDASELFLAVLKADLPGYRVYVPATSHRHAELSLPELIRKHYPDVPEDTADLIDTARIFEETGWQPKSNYGSGKTNPQ